MNVGRENPEVRRSIGLILLTALKLYAVLVGRRHPFYLRRHGLDVRRNMLCPL